MFKRKDSKKYEPYFNLAIAMATTLTGLYFALNVNLYQKDKETTKKFIAILEFSQTLWILEIIKYNQNYKIILERPNHCKFNYIHPQRSFQMENCISGRAVDSTNTFRLQL